MGVDARELTLNSQGPNEIWDSFLKGQSNSFESHLTPVSISSLGTLKSKVLDLGGIDFDSEASTTKFPAERSRKNGSLVLPLTGSWPTTTTTPHPKLSEILEKFGLT